MHDHAPCPLHSLPNAARRHGSYAGRELSQYKMTVPRLRVRKDWFVGLSPDHVDHEHPDIHAAITDPTPPATTPPTPPTPPTASSTCPRYSTHCTALHCTALHCTALHCTT